MLQVQHIEFLLVLAAVPLLILIYILSVRRKKIIARKLGDPRLVKELTKHYSPGKFNLKFILLLAGFVATAFALANVRSATDSETVARKGIDVMVALDVSNSMLAQDISPTRLDRAKQVVSRLIDKFGENRVGIVIFAGKAYLQMPLTSDLSAAKLYLSSASPSAVPTQGTVIEEALRMCHLSFNNKERKYKTVVLLSDGEDHEEGAVEMAKQMASEGVIIHAVGVGSQMGAMIPDVNTGQVKTDISGNPVLSRLNEASLRDIASNGNGTYQIFTSTDAVVNTIMSQISTMDQRAVKDDSLMNYESYFQYLLAIALLFLIIEAFISEMKKRKIEKKLKPAISAIFLLLTFSVSAQDDKELVKAGNEAYSRGDFTTAIANYAKAAQSNANNQAAIYNLGGALYKAQEVDKAIAAYDMAVKSAKMPMDKSNAHYNKGVVLQNGKTPEACIEEYKHALRINPNDEDARHNLQLALRKKKEDEKKDNKSQQDKSQSSDPQPKPSRLSKQDAEEKLKALEQQERNLHDKLKKVNTNATNKPEKDW